jgi:acetyltransferase-like isoleucine patch superfamily enzyme
VRLGALRALARSVLKDAYHFSRNLGSYLRLEVPAGAIVDSSLRVEHPERITIEPGVSIASDVQLLCSASGSIVLRTGATLSPGVVLRTEGSGVIEIGNRVSLAPRVQMRTSSRILIGEASEVLEATSIEPREDVSCGELVTGPRVAIHAYNWLDTTGSIRIGGDTHTGPFSMFYTHNHRYDQPGSIWDQGVRVGDITLGNGIWMGSKVMVMPGATIGDGAVIGAGSIVKGQFGSEELIVGSPAASVRKRQG